MRFFLVFLLMMGLVWGGCSKSAQQVETESVAMEAEPEDQTAMLGELKLSTPKSVYASDEPVPLELTLAAGKYDLLSAARYLVGDGAFAGLTVTNSDGATVPPRQIISISQATSKIYSGGKLIEAVPAMELISGKKHTTNLNNLQELYGLQSGVYQVQVRLRIPVYRGEKVPKQSPAIAQMEEEIALLNRDRKLNAEAKSAATMALRQQITELQQDTAEEEREYYVSAGAGSVRGHAEFESNILTITVQ